MIPFSPPKIYPEIIEEVSKVLQSGWITTGPRTKEFEKKLTEFCGNRSTLCLNSATSGLELMLRWFDVGKGDEVILPAYTYCATANVIMHCGAKPVFVDVGEDFNISPGAVEKAITGKTKVIMPVDIAGWPCDYDILNALVRKEPVLNKFSPSSENQEKLGRILILSDAAHSLGATYKGKRTGALTDISVFSFHAVKNLTTAEGGAVALNLPAPFDNEKIYERLCVKSLHGQSKDALAKTKGSSWKYDVVEPGYKMNMTDIHAVIGLVELSRYEKETLPRRKAIVNAYLDRLKAYSRAQLPEFKNDEKESSYHLFPLRIKGISEQQRDEIMAGIFRREVSVNVHFQPVPMLSFYKNQGYAIKDYPVTYDNYSREISLPVYYTLSDEEVEAVVRAVIESVDEVLAKNYA